MISSWMLYAVAVGVAISLAARAADRIAVLLALPRRGIWAAAMLATLVVPLAAPLWLGARGDPPAPRTAAVAEAVVPSVIPLPPSAPIEAPGRDWLSIVEGSLGWGWMALSVAGLLVLVGSSLSLRRLRRRWRPERVAGERVLVSARTGPAVVGVVRSAIVLPEWVLDWAPQQQRLIVRHEAEHALARDPLLMLGGCLAVIAAPWNLALWWQLRRLRLAVEMDCDRRVLGTRVDARSYGMLLLAVGQRTSTGWLPVTAFSEPRSFLERRIRSMTARRPRWWGAQVAALAAVVCAVPLVVHASPGVAPPSLDGLTGWLTPAQRSTTLWITPGYRLGSPSAPEIAEDALAEELARARRRDGSTALTVNLLTDAPGIGYAMVMTTRAACEAGFERMLVGRTRPSAANAPDVEMLGEEVLGGDCLTTISIPWVSPPSAGRETTATPDSVSDGVGGWAYRVGALDVAPRLVDAAAVRDIAERLRPQPVARAGVSMATLHFVVEADGRVAPGTVRATGTQAERLAARAPALLGRLRFEPGHYQGRPVRALVQMPMSWADPAASRSRDTVRVVAVRAYPAPVGGAAAPATPAPVTARGYATPRQAGQGPFPIYVVDGVPVPSAARAQPTRQEPVYELNALERQPALSNQEAISSVMDRLYPDELRERRAQGNVVAQFVIQPDGTVDMSTVRIVSTPFEELSEPTIRTVERMRFRPGRYDGRNVRVLVQMPVRWRPPSTAEAEFTAVTPLDFSGITIASESRIGAPAVRVAQDTASTATLVGIVRDGRTRAPIPGARVSTGSRGATANEEGRFVLRGLTPGRHEIRLTIPGRSGILPLFAVEVGAGTTMNVELFGPPE